MNFELLKDYLDSLPGLGVPGCDLTVWQNHREIFRHVSGESAPGTPMRGNENYWFYSATKVFTMTCAMQLIERGKMHLDDPVYEYLPAYRNLTVRDGDSVRPARTTLTIRHLMAMQGGLNYDLAAPPVAECLRKYGKHATTRQIVDALAQQLLQFDPGAHYLYSLCHDVVAAVIEVASSQSYGEYLRESVLEPLDIRTLTLHPTEAEKAALAARYRWDARENPIQEDNRDNPYRLSDRYESGGAGLFGNVDGYILLADALACGGVGRSGNRILNPESIDQLRENQQHGAARRDFDSFRRIGYGYGLGVRTLVDNRYSESPIGEFGWDGAAGAYVLIDPQNGLSAFFAAHVLGMGRAYTEFHPRIRDLIYTGLNTKGGQL